MEGLCGVIRLLPPDQLSHYTHLYLDHQLAVVQSMLSQPPSPESAQTLSTTLQLLTVAACAVLNSR